MWIKEATGQCPIAVVSRTQNKTAGLGSGRGENSNRLIDGLFGLDVPDADDAGGLLAFALQEGGMLLGR